MLEIYDYTFEEILALGDSTWQKHLTEPLQRFFVSSGDYQNAYKMSTDPYVVYAYSAIMDRIRPCVVLLTRQNLDDLGIASSALDYDDVPIVYDLVRSWNRWLVPKLGRLLAMQYIFYNDVATPSQLNFFKSLGMTEADLTATLERKQRYNDSPENVTDPDSDTWLTNYTNDSTTAIDPSKMTKLDYVKTLKSVFSDYLDSLERDFLTAFGYSPRLEIR